MPEEEYTPKRGDLVQFVDAGGEGEIGMVAGWAGKDTIRAKNLQSGEMFTGPFAQGFIVLLKKDEYDAMVNALPQSVELTDIEP